MSDLQVPDATEMQVWFTAMEAPARPQCILDGPKCRPPRSGRSVQAGVRHEGNHRSAAGRVPACLLLCPRTLLRARQDADDALELRLPDPTEHDVQMWRLRTGRRRHHRHDPTLAVRRKQWQQIQMRYSARSSPSRRPQTRSGSAHPASQGSELRQATRTPTSAWLT